MLTEEAVRQSLYLVSPNAMALMSSQTASSQMSDNHLLMHCLPNLIGRVFPPRRIHCRAPAHWGWVTRISHPRVQLQSHPQYHTSY